VAGTFNTLLMLRVKELETAAMLTEQLPQVEVFTLMSVSGVDDSSDPGSGVDFKSRNEDRISASEVPMLTAADMVTLPKGEAFALLEGGQLWKIRMPLPDDRDDAPPQVGGAGEMGRARRDRRDRCFVVDLADPGDIDGVGFTRQPERQDLAFGSRVAAAVGDGRQPECPVPKDRRLVRTGSGVASGRPNPVPSPVRTQLRATWRAHRPPPARHSRCPPRIISLRPPAVRPSPARSAASVFDSPQRRSAVSK